MVLVLATLVNVSANGREQSREELDGRFTGESFEHGHLASFERATPTLGVRVRSARNKEAKPR
jgi:hypothetical protein